MTEEYNEDMLYTMQPTGSDDLLFAMLAAFGVFMFIGFVISLLMYVFYGIGMSKIAKNEGHPAPWLAWVPIANIFMVPSSVEADVHGWLKGKFTKVNVVVYLLSLVLSFGVSFLVQFLPIEWVLFVYVPSLLLMFLPTLLLAYGFYFLVARYSENTVLHMVLAILTSGASVPFQLFRWRNREPIAN